MSTRITSATLTTIIAAAGLSLAGACATMNVHSYAERGTNLRQYRTYRWGPADTWSTGDPRLDNNRFFDERIRGQVEKELARRGFEKAGDDPADLLVHYHASVSQEIDIRQLDPPSSYGAEYDPPFVYDKGTLFVDLVDPVTDRVIWRGWAEGSLERVVDNQAWMESRIDETVAKILGRLPNRL
jgi:hypothetical protein